LPVEQQPVHVPEPVLQRSGLGRGRCGEGVRVNAGQRKMAEREAHIPAELLFDQLDRTEGLPRVRALVIAVLEDHTAGGRATDVIDFLVQRRQGGLAVVRACVGGHGAQPPVGMGPIRLARRFRSRLAGG
jgi:hypothetical protein